MSLDFIGTSTEVTPHLIDRNRTVITLINEGKQVASFYYDHKLKTLKLLQKYEGYFIIDVTINMFM